MKVRVKKAPKGHKAYQDGGLTMNTPEDQAAGYFKYPGASSLTFPGQGERTFVPGPFPIMVKDQRGSQVLNKKPIKTYGTVTEIPMYESGGEVKQAKKVKREDATIEAEKDELIFGAGAPGTVDDQEDRVGIGLYKIGGKKHSEGGTPLKAHPGDFVFSNDLSLAFNEDVAKELTGDEVSKKRLRTPAKLANKYIGLNTYIKDAQDSDLDPITRKTAALNINNYVDRLAEIAYAQEQKKGFPTGVPDFVKASLSSRFDSEGLQGQLNQFRYGGQVAKYQKGNTVPDDVNAEQVTTVPQGYTYYGTKANKTYYKSPNGKIIEVPTATPGGTPDKAWEQSIIDRLQSGVSPEELLRKKYIGPEGVKKYGKYYQPQGNDNFVYTSQDGMVRPDVKIPNIDMLQNSINVPNKPGISLPPPEEGGLDQYTSIPNTKFNINAAEAIGLFAAGKPYPSRYPTAFRNYEIQNAKSLTAASGRPISEQPYLNAIARSSVGRNDLGSFQASLGAQNQAISQVYAQNIGRQDARNQALAQLEVQDGLDRTQQFEKYDTKLETLANNKEMESKYRLQNLSGIANQMVRDRQSLGLINQMSDLYQVNPDYSIGLKPTYKIENGKLVPYQRNLADLIRSTTPTSNQYTPAIQLAQRLESMGYSRDEISRILARSVDDYDKKVTH